MPWLSLLVASSLALAGDWSKQPIEPKSLPDGTAYTIGTKTYRVGLVKQQVGLLDNLDLGVRVPLYALGLVNVHGKVTAIQTKRVDVSLDGEYIGASLDGFGVPDGRIRVYPVGWTASWMISKRFSLHGGTAWTVASAEGSLNAEQLAEGLEALTGADLSEELGGELSGAYAGANMSLFQTRLQAEYRLNRRDSLVLRSNNWLYLNALVAAGVDTGGQQAQQGTEVQAGASARVRLPLTESLQALTTLSWQFSWRRAHLRLGIPVPLSNTFAWLQAVDFYVLLGPGRKAPPPQAVGEAPEEAPEATEEAAEPAEEASD